MRSWKFWKKLNDGGSPSFDNDPAFIANVPHQIEAHWDADFGPRLAGFPLNLLYTGVRKGLFGRRVESCCYWPDLGSYAEDDNKRKMTYFPKVKSAYHVRVEYDKKSGSWCTLKYKGEKLIADARGPEFDGAMVQATLIGLQPDEPIDRAP